MAKNTKKTTKKVQKTEEADLQKSISDSSLDLIAGAILMGASNFIDGETIKSVCFLVGLALLFVGSFRIALKMQKQGRKELFCIVGILSIFAAYMFAYILAKTIINLK